MFCQTFNVGAVEYSLGPDCKNWGEISRREREREREDRRGETKRQIEWYKDEWSWQQWMTTLGIQRPIRQHGTKQFAQSQNCLLLESIPTKKSCLLLTTTFVYTVYVKCALIISLHSLGQIQQYNTTICCWNFCAHARTPQWKIEIPQTIEHLNTTYAEVHATVQ